MPLREPPLILCYSWTAFPACALQHALPSFMVPNPISSSGAFEHFSLRTSVVTRSKLPVGYCNYDCQPEAPRCDNWSFASSIYTGRGVASLLHSAVLIRTHLAEHCWRTILTRLLVRYFGWSRYVLINYCTLDFQGTTRDPVTCLWIVETQAYFVVVCSKLIKAGFRTFGLRAGSCTRDRLYFVVWMNLNIS